MVSRESGSGLFPLPAQSIGAGSPQEKAQWPLVEGRGEEAGGLFIFGITIFCAGKVQMMNAQTWRVERDHQNSKCVWAPDLGEGQAVCNTSK